MKRSGILFALWLILSLVSVVTSGCGYRVAATIQANAEATPVPTKFRGRLCRGLRFRFRLKRFPAQTVSVPLATALSLYNWKWLSNPDRRRSRRAGADLVDDRRAAVHHGTGRSFYRPGLSFGTGIGFGSSPWHRGRSGMHGRRSMCPSQAFRPFIPAYWSWKPCVPMRCPRPRWRHCFRREAFGHRLQARACGEAGRRSFQGAVCAADCA